METCKEFISNLVVTLPHYFPSPLVWLISSSLAIAGTFLFIQVYKTYSYLKEILNSKIPTPESVKKVALELGIEDKLTVTKDGAYTSFCYGLFFPKICLNLELAQSLTKKELKAILLHESHHLESKDPLKILITQTIQSFFFFLPISKDFHNHFLLSLEIAADRAASRSGVSLLRRALIKSISLPETKFAFARFYAEESLEQRVKILTEASSNISFKLSTLRLLTSVLVVGFYLVFMKLPIYAVDQGRNHSYYLCTKTERNFTPASYSPTR